MAKVVSGRYEYRPRGRNWAIYFVERMDNGCLSGTKISEKMTKEEARDEVYRLNGWKKR